MSRSIGGCIRRGRYELATETANLVANPYNTDRLCRPVPAGLPLIFSTYTTDSQT
jgi:hypothetical protein